MIYHNDLINDKDFLKLLGRKELVNQTNFSKEFIKNKIIIVTGGAGSIGSCLCRNLLLNGAALVCAVDINENELFLLSLEFKEYQKSGKFIPKIASVRDFSRIYQIVNKIKPDIIYHCAAHKHVPMMEIFPCEAVKNNVLGTYNCAKAAALLNIKRFILISTDKAVEPISVMGKTKLAAEKVLALISQEYPKTNFATVRFGNVLGSRGSIIPIFKQQIENGGPITLTHPQMYRFFMSISEAVMLLNEVASMSFKNEIFTLEMGEQISITTLAENMIRLYNLIPYKDILITYNGIRPGEKLCEKLSADNEIMIKTSNSYIYKTYSNFENYNVITNLINSLFANACENNDNLVLKALNEITLASSTEKASLLYL